MKIELIYRPTAGGGERFGQTPVRRVFELPEEAKVEDILPRLYSKGLVEWEDDSMGGYVSGDLIESGELAPGKTYRVMSFNIPRTYKAMQELDDSLNGELDFSYVEFDEEKYDEAYAIASGIVMGWGCFEFRDTSYYLRTCPSENEDGTPNGQPAEHGCSQGIWTVYIWDDIGEKIQRPLLFHEIVEIYFMENGLEDEDIAHNLTMPWEKRFCKDFLSQEEISEYLGFKLEHGYNGFEKV